MDSHRVQELKFSEVMTPQDYALLAWVQYICHVTRVEEDPMTTQNIQKPPARRRGSFISD